jgi:carboxynorspermidine decarboxylase
LLAGSTCLAGDIFGEYAFDEPLQVGSRIIFCNVGAYTQVKAHMFNGINLPAMYSLSASGRLVRRKRFTYADFKARIGE